jgi:hypothetical protein
MHEFPPEVERKLREESRRFREPLPQRVLNKPNLFFGNALFLNAWFDLDLERERPQPITRSMCFAYADDYGLGDEQRDDLWFFVKRMDLEFIPWWNKKQPKPKQPRKTRGK